MDVSFGGPRQPAYVEQAWLPPRPEFSPVLPCAPHGHTPPFPLRLGFPILGGVRAVIQGSNLMCVCV